MVKNSAIGKVHQTLFIIFDESINKYAARKTKTTSQHKAVINGFNANLNA